VTQPGHLNTSRLIMNDGATAEWAGPEPEPWLAVGTNQAGPAMGRRLGSCGGCRALISTPSMMQTELVRSQRDAHTNSTL
jgi:hypothetical protein